MEAQRSVPSRRRRAGGALVRRPWSGVGSHAHDLDRERAAGALVAHDVAGAVAEQRLAER